jgi:hypothetical protein
MLLYKQILMLLTIIDQQWEQIISIKDKTTKYKEMDNGNNQIIIILEDN